MGETREDAFKSSITKCPDEEFAFLKFVWDMKTDQK